VIFLLVATVAQAETNTLSLAEAKRLAFQRNWDLLAAKSGVDAATAQLLVAKEFPNPSLSWSTARIGEHAGTTLGNDLWQRSYDTIFAVNQLIEIGGKRGDRQKAGRAGVTGARARFFDAKRTLDQGVTKAYVAALLAGENARVLNDSARMLRHEADIGQARLKAGDISESDEKQIEISADVFELQAKSAEATAVQARISVEILLAVTKPSGDWTPADTLPELASISPGDGETGSGDARPDVIAAESDLRASEANLRLQRATRIPDPTFLVQYEHNPLQPPDNDTIGIGVSFPLPLWNWNRGNIHAAQAALDQSQEALGKVRTQVLSDIANAQVEYDEASQRWKRYQESVLPQSARVRDAVAFSYEKGGASLVDLLEAERTDNDNRLAGAQAMSDTAGAVADLNAARNVVSENALGEEEAGRKKP
jgi:cobalt-zinc-cadmium efflux system outer membrane protein